MWGYSIFNPWPFLIVAAETKNTAYFKVFGAAQTQNHGIVAVGVVVVVAAAAAAGVVVVVVACSGRKSSNSWCFRVF